MAKRATWVVAGAALVVVAAVVVLLESRSIYAGNIDLARHYQLVYWIEKHHTIPATPTPALGEMAGYPPGAHIPAAIVGWILRSPLLGLQVITFLGVTAIWAAIGALLCMFPGFKRWSALSVMMVILVVTAEIGPLKVQLTGFEIIANFFYSQIVGEALFWLVAAFVVWGMRSDFSYRLLAWPTAVCALVCTEIHVVPAIQLLVLLGIVSLRELIRRFRSDKDPGLTKYVFPVVLPAATATLFLFSPGFRVMQQGSGSDGVLEVPYINGALGAALLALVVLVVAAGLLAWSLRRPTSRPGAVVTSGICFIAASIAIPCILQFALLTLGGAGAPYAVKKYVFGLFTVLALELCALAAAATPVRLSASPEQPRQRSVLGIVGTVAAVGCVVVVSAWSLFDRPSALQTMQTVAVERQVGDYALLIGHVPGKQNYAFALPESPPTVDYMFSTTWLGVLPSQDSWTEGFPAFSSRTGFVLTTDGSIYGVPKCRVFGPQTRVVVVNGQCVKAALERRARLAAAGSSGSP